MSAANQEHLGYCVQPYPCGYHGDSQKPVLVNGGLENHEFLCVTISIDHDIVDGAPAARFIQRLKELVETGYGVDEFIKQLEEK